MTGNLEAGARAKLHPFDLNRFFPTGGFGTDHEDRRVVSDIARRRMEALRGHEFPPDRVWLVGDTVMDVRSGKAHGFATVAVTTGWTARETLLKEHPDYLLDHLEELLDSPEPAL